MTGPHPERDCARTVEAARGYAYRFPLWNDGGTEDDCAPFLLAVDPRLAGYVERFEDMGRPFAAYLYACMRWQWKTYLRRRNAHANRPEQTVAQVLMLTPDDPPGEWHHATLDRASMRKDVTVAAVKAAADLEPAQVAVLAKATGRADLPALIERARSMVDTTRADKLRARVHNSLGRRLEGRTDGHATAYDNAVRELRAARRGLSNRQVAAVLDMPKGSVDTSLHRLRRRVAAG